MANRSWDYVKQKGGQFILSPPFIVFFLTLFLHLISKIDASKFGQSSENQIFLARWAFNPAQPFANSGLPLVFSFLFHNSFWHWILNALCFFWLSHLVVRKLGVIKCCILIFVFNLLINWGIHFYFLQQPAAGTHYFLGLSGVVLAFLGLVAFYKPRIFLLPTIGLFLFYLWEWQVAQIAAPEVVAHMIALVIGILFGLVFEWSARDASERDHHRHPPPANHPPQA